MATVQIRNLDDIAYDVLRRRAAESGRSLQEYLRIQLEDLAARPALPEAIARARGRVGGEVPIRDIVELQRRARGNSAQ